MAGAGQVLFCFGFLYLSNNGSHWPRSSSGLHDDYSRHLRSPLDSIPNSTGDPPSPEKVRGIPEDLLASNSRLRGRSQ